MENDHSIIYSDRLGTHIRKLEGANDDGLFWGFQCISGPTSMAIASIIAAEKAKNANGSCTFLHTVHASTLPLSCR